MDITNRFWKYIGERIIHAYTPPETTEEKPAEETAERRPSIEVARSLVSKLDCPVSWDEKEGNMYSCDVMYQGGRFVLRVWENHPYAVLMFPCFFSADTIDVDMVRSVVNRINMESILTRVVTSTLDQTGDIQCHVMTHLVFDDDSPARLRALYDAMNACFGVRHDFEQYIREEKASGVEDPQMAAANRRRELYLLGEQAWTHGKQGLRVPPQPSMPLTLGELLRRMFDWQDIADIRLRVVRGTEVLVVEHAVDYDPLDAILPADAQGGEACLLMEVSRRDLKLFDENIITPQRTPCMVTAMMRMTHTDEIADYVQVVLAREGGVPGGVRSLQHPEMKGDSVTFTIARDKTDSQEHHDEYKFTLADAKDKIAQGKSDQLTDVQELLLANETGYNEGYNIYWGEEYIRHERYVEALAHLLSVYEVQRHNFLRMSQRQKGNYYGLMFDIGLCYARLQQFEKAYFFLDAAAQSNNNNHLIELINCAVNSSDSRAEQLLSNVMSHLQEQINENQDDDDFDPDALQPFIRFLNMRRAYLLIEQRQWAQAEQLLNHLLNDEEAAEFAMNELAYIATRREAS